MESSFFGCLVAQPHTIKQLTLGLVENNGMYSMLGLYARIPYTKEVNRVKESLGVSTLR